MSTSLKSKLIDKPKQCSGLYIGSDIPPKKLSKAIKAYAKEINPDDVIALFDDTVFGSATDGFLLTENAIIESYNKNTIPFEGIESISCIKDEIILSNGITIKPVITSSIDVSWLCKQLDNHIHDNGNPRKDIKTIYEESALNDDQIFTSTNIPNILSNYLISLNDIVPDFENIIKNEDIIAIISNKTINTSDDINLQEILFITDKYIFYKEMTEQPHIFPLNAIVSCSIDDNIFTLRFPDGSYHSFEPHLLPEENKEILNKFFSIIKEYIDKHSSKDPTLEYKYFENYFYPPEEKAAITSRIFKGTTDIVSNNPLFKVISLLNGKSIIIVAFLRNNAPERVLKQLQKLPGVGLAAGVASIALGRALNWLNNQIMKHGEAYMMEQLVKNFNERGVLRPQLEKEINSNIYTILGDDIIEESMNLLNKYMPADGSIESNENINCPDEIATNNINNDFIICNACGTQNNINSKFCSNCGEKLKKEYKCVKCGYSQTDPMKFCPECGEKITE